jgi:hypothetical protein
MKRITQHAKRSTLLNLVLALGLALALGGSVTSPLYHVQAQGAGPQASPLGTGFTYQGRLVKNDAPVDGVTCTFTFDLHDAATGGTPLDTDSKNAELKDGYFTVALDFGGDAFTGEARWLEAAVQCPGDGSPVPLDDQRVPLSAAPYAHSLRPGAIVEGSATGTSPGGAVFNVQNDDLSAGHSAIFGVSGSGLGGYPGEAVGVRGEAVDGYGVAGRSANSIGVYGSSIGSNGVWGTSTSGYGVRALSASNYGVYASGGAGDLQLANGTLQSTTSDSSDLILRSNDHVDIHLDDDGNSTSWFRILNDLDNVVFAVDESGTITGSIGADNSWSLSGNAGTDPNANFLGTTDDQPLELRVNDARALRLEPNASSPNLIGGHSSNNVNPGVAGATIGGGGRSGAPNRAQGDYATVGGGGANRAASYATVGGGWLNVAHQMNAVVAGGSGNEAKGNSATVGGGWNNSAGGYHATIGGGKENTTDAEAATIAGGDSNIASGDYATVPGGLFADASHYGEMAHASGSFLLPGDAQGSFYVLRGTSYDDTPAELFLDGDAASQRLTVANNRVVTFDILVAARSEFGWSAGYTVQGVIENYLGTTAFVGFPTVTTLGETTPAWDLTVVADDVNDALIIQGSGSMGETTRWVATVRTAEVAWAAVETER